MDSHDALLASQHVLAGRQYAFVLDGIHFLLSLLKEELIAFNPEIVEIYFKERTLIFEQVEDPILIKSLYEMAVLLFFLRMMLNYELAMTHHVHVIGVVELGVAHINEEFDLNHPGLAMQQGHSKSAF